MSLPDLPSALIRVALADLRKVEALEDFKIDMSCWHAREREGPCTVCLAGAVMAQTLGLGTGPAHHWACPADFPEETRKLMALEWFRAGEISLGVRTMGLPRESNRSSERCVTGIPSYAVNREDFHAALHSLADMFEKEGL